MEWDGSRQTHSVEIWMVQKLKFFSLIHNRWRSLVLGPYLPRRVAQSAWESLASGCLSSAVACVLCKPLGRVSLAAHDDEQRREQAEARVHFLLVTYSLGKQRKVTRLQAKEYITNNHKSAA
jgi:hypothetical protein